MSKQYQDTSWTGDDTTLNESYLSADNSPSNNTTQYFSMLEDTVVHDDSADTTVDETSATEGDTLLQEPDKVMLYRIQGSDDMYAVQVAEDENGKLQKYQFKVRPTSDGQYEAVQDTITVIPFDASDPIIPHILDEENIPPATEETTSSEQVLEEVQQVDVKCEQLSSSVVCADEGEQQLEQFHDGAEDQYQYEEESPSNSALDTKEGILHLQSTQEEVSPSSNDLKMEYFRRSSENDAEQEESPKEDFDDEPIEQKIVLTEQEEGGSAEHLYPEMNHHHEEEQEEENDAVEMLADGIEYVGVEEPDYDGSIVDESTQQLDQEETEENSHQVLEGGVENAFNEDEEDDAEYILATGLQDGEIDPDNGDIEYQQIFVTNDEQLKSPMKTYLDASQLQQLTLAAAASNNNQLPPNAAYIVTKIINENQSITTTATSIDQGVKLVRNLKIKRITNPPPPNRSITQVPTTLLITSPNSSTSRFIEKENVSNINANVISNMLKPNPRSILKASHVILRKPEEDVEEQIDKRFARSKELQRKRMFRDYIAQTTILQAPVRQERLPRKQLIKPVRRTDEEIIVREMVISSSGNGFIETTDGKVKENNVTSISKSFEILSDSDSDFRPYNTGKRKRKYRKRKQLLQNPQASPPQSPEEIDSDDSVMSSSLQEAIDLSADSEGEEIIETIIINSPGKRRGRPPKAKQDSSSPTKRRGRPPKTRQSPDETETIRIIPSTEHKCTQCSKVFPSVGSLRSHMNFHKYMEEQPKDPPDEQPKPLGKYSCGKCSSTFKNAILLTKHVTLHDKKDALECKVCRKVFSDNNQLTAHRKSHAKDNMFQSTQISPRKRSNIPSFKCLVCNKTFSSSVLLEAHGKSHRNVFTCKNCSRDFMSKVLLDKHVRIECVKRKSTDGKKRLSFVAKRASISANTSVFAKPKSKIHLPRRTALRSKSATSQDDGNHIDNGSEFTSQESIASSSSAVRTPIRNRLNSSNISRGSSTNSVSGGVGFNLKCDQCEEVFKSFRLRYRHQVLQHGMLTNDTTITTESEKKERRRITKPIGAHSGVPANANLSKAFASLQEKIKNYYK